MAYISPSGTIELMKGVNLDNRYMHTLYFASVSARDNYFTPLVTNRYTNQMYTRVNNGIIKVRAFCEDINDVTYLRFQNRPNGRYYYAFVTAVEYINENNTRITFEIDVMQTWYFGGTAKINPCFVKRMHVSDDTFRKHLEPEPVGSEMYRMDLLNTEGGGSFGEYSVIINSTTEPEKEKLMLSGIFCGTEYHAAKTTNANLVKGFIEDALGSWDYNERKSEITDLYMFPTEYCTIDLSGGTNSKTIKVYGTSASNTYNPINKKLYTYPYAFLYATTFGGDNAEYRWEYFDSEVMPNGVIDFFAESCEAGGGEIICYPDVYNGIDHNYDARLTINNFPKCSYAIDAYQAWVASGGQTRYNASADILNQRGMIAFGRSASDLVGGMMSVNKITEQAVNNNSDLALANAFLGVVKTGINVGTNIDERLTTLQEAKNKLEFSFKDAMYQPNIVVGDQNCNTSVGKKFLGLYFYNCHVDPVEMVRIDNFFSTYGYSINEVVTPLDHGRPYWNFLQTEGAQVSGDMPASSKEAIARILDGGIFFWNSANITNSNIGNFRMQTRTVNGGTQIVNTVL